MLLPVQHNKINFNLFLNHTYPRKIHYKTKIRLLNDQVVEKDQR